MTAAQILAVILFAAMFLLIVSEKIERHVVSLVCGLLMLVLVFGVCMKSPRGDLEYPQPAEFFLRQLLV